MDLAYKFWRDYLKADILKRSDMLDKTLIVSNMRGVAKSGLTDEQFRFTVKSTLMSYFDDLLEYLDCCRLDEVTRFEVIDEKGRQYVKYKVKVRDSLQDNNRTLKVFVEKRK